MMEYRLLTEQEKKKLAEVFPQYKGVKLDNVPIAGAIDEKGDVRGLVVLNHAPHCEPIWIEKGTPVDFRRLVSVVEKLVQGPLLWAFAPNGHIRRMAEICGFEHIDWNVMRKEL